MPRKPKVRDFIDETDGFDSEAMDEAMAEYESMVEMDSDDDIEIDGSPTCP